MTMFAGSVPVELMANVALRIDRLDVRDGQIIITASIDNNSAVTLPTYSTTGMPIRLSTRFIDTDTTPRDLEHGQGWNSRRDIAFDIPPGSSQSVSIRMPPPTEPGTYRVAVSMVQDGVAWFHDRGLHIPISARTVTVDHDHAAHVSDATR